MSQGGILVIMRVKTSSYSSSNGFHLNLSYCGQDDGTVHRDTLPPILMTWSSPKTHKVERENWLLQFFFYLASICALWHLCGHTCPSPTPMQNSFSGLLGWCCSLVTKGLPNMHKAASSICYMGKREAKDKTTKTLNHTELSVHFQYVPEGQCFQLVKNVASWPWRVTYNSTTQETEGKRLAPITRPACTVQFLVRLSWLWRESLSQNKKNIFIKLCGECWPG